MLFLQLWPHPRLLPAIPRRDPYPRRRGREFNLFYFLDAPTSDVVGPLCECNSVPGLVRRGRAHVYFASAGDSGGAGLCRDATVEVRPHYRPRHWRDLALTAHPAVNGLRNEIGDAAKATGLESGPSSATPSAEREAAEADHGDPSTEPIHPHIDIPMHSPRPNPFDRTNSKPFNSNNDNPIDRHPKIHPSNDPAPAAFTSVLEQDPVAPGFHGSPAGDAVGIVSVLDHRTGGLRYCGVCELYIPDFAHHCRVCRRCVYRMDHHCPWVNNCVGRNNYKLFVLFICYLWLASLGSAGGLALGLLALDRRPSEQQLVWYILMFVYIVVGLVFFLFHTQYVYRNHQGMSMMDRAIHNRIKRSAQGNGRLGGADAATVRMYNLTERQRLQQERVLEFRQVMFGHHQTFLQRWLPIPVRRDNDVDFLV